ncbi:hypothetical protein HDU83_000642 [Entophlyctis luteolus]|nr:hypothetical protein HDU83_000642 [Entophlyctis luteolus]KAJ3371992.1 hypothetical protein HDU84_001214 [Entophlyctis sp. JEL0112]
MSSSTAEFSAAATSVAALQQQVASLTAALSNAADSATNEYAQHAKREARLRKVIAHLESRIDEEIAQTAEFRVAATDRESELMAALAAERATVRELKAKLALTSQEPAKGLSAVNTATLTALSNKPSDYSLKEDKLALKKLASHIVELNVRMAAKDAKIKKQETDILELQSLVHSLMNEIEQQQQQTASAGEIFDSSDFVNMQEDNGFSAKHSLAADLERHLATPPRTPIPSSTELVQDHLANAEEPSSARVQGDVNASDGNSSDGTSSAEEARMTLRQKLTAFGLSTEGRRAVLKKRLARYIARKKKQAAKVASGAEPAVTA